MITLSNTPTYNKTRFSQFRRSQTIDILHRRTFASIAEAQRPESVPFRTTNGRLRPDTFLLGQRADFGPVLRIAPVQRTLPFFLTLFQAALRLVPAALLPFEHIELIACQRVLSNLGRGAAGRLFDVGRGVRLDGRRGMALDPPPDGPDQLSPLVLLSFGRRTFLVLNVQGVFGKVEVRNGFSYANKQLFLVLLRAGVDSLVLRSITRTALFTN